MSGTHLTPAMVDRSVWVIDQSGVLDLVCPPRQAGQVGRIGNLRENTRLLLIGWHLCSRLGHETTVRNCHRVLTTNLSRDKLWELGVLRPLTTNGGSSRAAGDPDGETLTLRGKPRKRRWVGDGVEELGYDDLSNAATALRKRLDYGNGCAPELHDDERAAREATVDAVVDALIAATTIPRTGSTWAIDATGQWAWTRGGGKTKAKMEKALRETAGDQPGERDAALQVAAIAEDADGRTAPQDQSAPPPAPARGRCLDAAWGYKTSKDGGKETGFGFHMHTIARVPDPNAGEDDEPLLIDGFKHTPANDDVVAASLRLVDRIRARHSFTRLVGDLLYTNLRASRWAVPLAERGIEQGLMMRSDNHKVVDIHGAQMQHAWLHCPSAPMDTRPLPPTDIADTNAWEGLHDKVDAFQTAWAFARKESGLGANHTSKWVCPALDGRAGCHARGTANVEAARDLGLPIITPPEDWQTRPACVQKTVDFTPDADDPNHQRKLAQRHYYGSRKQRNLFKRRTLVEGAFGILKNASRLRMRRGHNRLPGLAMAAILGAVKVSLFNEEQLRAWHEDTGRGPADHPLLQPDPPYWGFTHLTKEQAKAIDAEHLRRLRDDEARGRADAAA